MQVSFLTNGFSFASFFKPGEKWVGARLTDHVPGVVPPPRSIWTWSTSFEVLDVAGRGTDLLVVLGAARNGETVIERWDITVPTGAPTAVLPRAAAVVGTPVVSQAPLLGVQGGTPIPPLQRPAPQQPVRTEVYRGPSLGTDMEIEVDPDGRFVLVLARDPGVLYRVLLTENASTDVVFDTTASPSLGSVIALQTFRHDTLGRQVAGRIKGGAPLSRVVLFDFDNDGVFDLVEEMTMQDCANFGLPQAWVEDYTNYSGVLAPYQW